MAKIFVVLGSVLFSAGAYASAIPLNFPASASLDFWGNNPSPLQLLGIERSAEIEALKKCTQAASGSCYVSETVAAKCEAIQEDYNEGLRCTASATAKRLD